MTYTNSRVAPTERCLAIMASNNSLPEAKSEHFDLLYREWRDYVERSVSPYSSSDRNYIQNPHFDAIVDLGSDALPFIMEKLRSDENAHFLIHALVRITGKNFSLKELKGCRPLADGRIGNQTFVQLWLSWWDSKQPARK